ncbi:MAG: choice-of-anchor tandem repeat GloVer-containing protein [Candidatus Baltobacteraceae bacterium]
MRVTLSPAFAVVSAILVTGCAGSSSPIGATTPAAISPATTSYEVLHRFSLKGGAASVDPTANLLDVNGTLYGTTLGKGGPKHECGTVFSISTSGSKKTLHRFRGRDGCYPIGSLTDVNGTLYGTTVFGGTCCGVIYSLTTSGVEKMLYSFKGAPDGSHPWAGMVEMNGVLYGTTSEGGTSAGSICYSSFNHGCGTVYSVSTSGDEAVLYSFTGGKDGQRPTASLIVVNGTLYGTTIIGGGPHSDFGTVFSMTTSGSESILHKFTGGADGVWPFAPLIYSKGTFYGTTERGGASNLGTVYSISPSGSQAVLYSFGGGSDGQNPLGSLVGLNGVLYGTASYGGDSACKSSYPYSGCGTIYSVTTSGSEQVLHAFHGADSRDGAFPQAGLTNHNGTLYGTTVSGGGKASGGYGSGTVFAITP